MSSLVCIVNTAYTHNSVSSPEQQRYFVYSQISPWPAHATEFSVAERAAIIVSELHVRPGVDKTSSMSFQSSLSEITTKCIVCIYFSKQWRPPCDVQRVCSRSRSRKLQWLPLLWRSVTQLQGSARPLVPLGVSPRPQNPSLGKRQ